MYVKVFYSQAVCQDHPGQKFQYIRPIQFSVGRRLGPGHEVDVGGNDKRVFFALHLPSPHNNRITSMISRLGIPTAAAAQSQFSAPFFAADATLMDSLFWSRHPSWL